MGKIGLGLIGCGVIGAGMHAPAIANLKDAEFVAVCDGVEARAQGVAAQFGVSTVYTDTVKLFADPRIEAVVVATPHPSHCPLAKQAAAARKHVIVEKPLSVDLKQADEAIEAGNKAGIKFGVIFQRRFWPAAQRAKKAIADGKLDRVILGDCIVKWWRAKGYYDRDSWRGTWAAEGGGVMVNQAVHAIDMYQWLMGPIDSIYGLWGNLSHSYIEVEDAAVAAMRFKNGALGIISTTVSTNPQLGSRITVTGENGGTISVLEHPEGKVGVNDVWTVPGEQEEGARVYAEQLKADEWMFQPQGAVGTSTTEHFTTYHQLQLQDFVDAIREDREPAVTAEEGRKAVEIIMSIYESGRTGKPIKYPFHG
jgi:UDP-N-acetyl-2-amino-2-deoxyglucuronate dehydrogenase